MSDRYASFANSGAGRALVKRLGLPDPPRLRRYRPGDPLRRRPGAARRPAAGSTGPVRKIARPPPASR